MFNFEDILTFAIYELKNGFLLSTKNKFVSKIVSYEYQSQLAPEFTQILRMSQAKEHEVAQFECKVTGEPRPQVRWFKDGQELVASKNLMMQLENGGIRRLLKDFKDLILFM